MTIERNPAHSDIMLQAAGHLWEPSQAVGDNERGAHAIHPLVPLKVFYSWLVLSLTPSVSHWPCPQVLVQCLASYSSL